jgi:hypothetical protein
MDNMKLLRYARAAAVDKWWCYDKIANQYTGHRAESLARKLADEAKADVNAIAEMIRAEEAKRRMNADVIAELKNLAEKIVAKEQSAETQQSAGGQRMKQAIKEAPYVLVVKWNNPIMGEMEYPCKSYAEAEKSFEVAKREVHNGNVTEAHVYEQIEGQRVPMMGIMSGKL